MICPKCSCYMLLHPEAKFNLIGWRKCACGFCKQEHLQLVKEEEIDEEEI